MVNESLRSLRKGMLAAFVLVVAWALALPSTVSELRARHAAEQLTSWLVLRNKFVDTYDGRPPDARAFHERFVSTTADSGVIDSEMKYPAPERADLRPGGDNLPEPQPLTLQVQWPGEESLVTVGLQARIVDGLYEVYEVQTNARFLPFDEYAVVIDTVVAGCPCIEVLARQEWASEPRQLQFDFNLRNQPRDWEGIAMLIWPGALEPSAADELSQSNPAVAGFVKDALRPQHAVWGVSVDPGLFFVAPGLLLGAQAFMLLGSVLVLTNRRDAKMSDPWIMTTPTRSPPRGLLEGALVLISVIWCLMPIGLGIVQTTQSLRLHPFERILYGMGTLGLVAASIASTMTLLQLRRIRRGSSVRNGLSTHECRN